MGEPGDRERPAMAVRGVCEYRGRANQGQRAPFGAIRFDGLLLRAARHFLSVCDRPIGRVPIQAPDTGQSVSIRLPLDVAASLQSKSLQDMRWVGTRPFAEIFKLLFVDVGKNPCAHENRIQAS